MVGKREELAVTPIVSPVTSFAEASIAKRRCSQLGIVGIPNEDAAQRARCPCLTAANPRSGSIARFILALVVSGYLGLVDRLNQPIRGNRSRTDKDRAFAWTSYRHTPAFGQARECIRRYPRFVIIYYDLATAREGRNIRRDKHALTRGRSMAENTRRT